jgi:hypothetical protein
VNELLCSHCGDAIGVYEPLVAVVDGRPLETSRAAEPRAGEAAVPCFHRGCYEQAHAEASPAS